MGYIGGTVGTVDTRYTSIPCKHSAKKNHDQNAGFMKKMKKSNFQKHQMQNLSERLGTKLSN